MDLHPRQFVRINVKTVRSEGVEKFVDRNFSVDPRTITLDRLRHLLARALDVRGEFTVLCFRSSDESPVPLTCDWDLEGALSEEPRIDLTLELQPKEPGLEEWDIICPADVPVAGHEASVTPPPRKGSFLEQILQLCSPYPQLSVPLTESEFAPLADWPCPLRYAVYRAGGADPSLRSTLWMHLLDVYPTGATHADREQFLNRKAEEYYGLRHSWQRLVQAGTIPPFLRDVTCLVRKDVRRTDRLLDLDERALYNVLTTYAVHHPSVGYCQGMSDLLSPLLHVMKTEARAYVALCGLMLRMRDNFRRDGRSVRTKFRHLRRALRAHDPALHAHLSQVGALDLLFCYRWLLLDLKREFPYHEMLRLMEVMWSTLRPVHREKGVELYEVRFPRLEDREALSIDEDAGDWMEFAEDHFSTEEDVPGRTLLVQCPQTLQKITKSHRNNCLPSEHNGLQRTAGGLTHEDAQRKFLLSQKTQPASCPTYAALNRWGHRRKFVDSESSTDEEDEPKCSGESVFRHRRRRRRSRNDVLCRSWDAKIPHQKFNDATLREIPLVAAWPQEERRRHGSSDSNYGSNFSEEEEEELDRSGAAACSSSRSRSEGYDSHQTLTDHSSCSDDDQGEEESNHFLKSIDSANTFFNHSELQPQTPPLLPPPTRLGDGKPFLLFLCLTMILRHRDEILGRGMDAGEIGIYFDRMVRKHRIADVLPTAKELFAEYLRTGWTDDE